MKERLPIESGVLLLIDQFMLSNPQFISAAEDAGEDLAHPDASKLQKAVASFGGWVASLENGSYTVHRDPKRKIMAVCSEGSGPPEAPPRSRGEEHQEEEDEARALFFENIIQQRPEDGDRVCVDTRCLAFVDAAILAKKDVLEKFRELRLKGREKDARDFLREHGATVRYSFERESDVLLAAPVEGGAKIGVWGIARAESGSRSTEHETD